jgi:hypothetical protein
MNTFHRISIFVAFTLLIVAFRPTALQAQSGGTTNPSSGTTADRTVELEARVKALEDRYEQASGFRDTDYILRIQKQYETYYEKAFNTQVNVVWAVGAISALVLALGGIFSFTMLEKVIRSATSEATGELRTNFDQRLTSGLAELGSKNRDHTAKAIEDLRTKTDTAIKSIVQRVHFDFQASQAITLSTARRYAEARHCYGTALDTYLEDVTAYVKQVDSVVTLVNIFQSFLQEDAPEFGEKAKEELKKPRYSKLQGELRIAAMTVPGLGPLLI